MILIWKMDILLCKNNADVISCRKYFSPNFPIFPIP